MRYSLFLAASLVLAPVVGAQTVDPRCGAGTPEAVITQDGCQKSIDLFNYMAPQLAGALSANPTTTAPNFALSLSATSMAGDIPQFTNTTLATSGATSTTYQTKTSPMPMPAITGAMTLYPGFMSPIGRIGRISALGALTYIPNINTNGLSLSAVGSNWKFTGGTRVDLNQEGGIMPQLSFTALTRTTPRMNLMSVIDFGDTVRVDTVSISTHVRAFEARKTIGILGLLAGYSSTKFVSSATARGTVEVPSSAPVEGGTNQPVGPVSLSQNLTRTDIYGGLSLQWTHFAIQARAGAQNGGAVSTYNQFQNGSSTHPADMRRLYGAAALAFTF